MSLAHSSAQVPAEKGDAVYTVGTGTGPTELSEGPQGSLGKGGFGWLLFLGRKLFFSLTSLGNWKPWVLPRAIKRPCPLSRLKIKTPTQEHPRLGGGAEAAGRPRGGGARLTLGPEVCVCPLSGLWSSTALHCGFPKTQLTGRFIQPLCYLWRGAVGMAWNLALSGGPCPQGLSWEEPPPHVGGERVWKHCPTTPPGGSERYRCT